MKTIRLLFGLMLVSFMAFAPMTAKAHKGHKGHKGRHARVHTPYWIPAHVVRANMRHVYFPNYNVYYDRWNGTYIYLEGRRWTVSARIPFYFRDVNFARAHKVGLNIDSSRPYVYNRYHVADYRSGKRYRQKGSYYGKGYGQYRGHGSYKKSHSHGKYDDDHKDNRRRGDDKKGKWKKRGGK